MIRNSMIPSRDENWDRQKTMIDPSDQWNVNANFNLE